MWGRPYDNKPINDPPTYFCGAYILAPLVFAYGVWVVITSHTSFNLFRKHGGDLTGTPAILAGLVYISAAGAFFCACRRLLNTSDRQYYILSGSLIGFIFLAVILFITGCLKYYKFI